MTKTSFIGLNRDGHEDTGLPFRVDAFRCILNGTVVIFDAKIAGA